MVRLLTTTGLAVLAAPALARVEIIGPEQMTFFRIGTASVGGTYFPIGGIIANSISNPPGSPPCERGGSCGVPNVIASATASAGSVENIANIISGTSESGLIQANIAHWAYRGIGLYEETGPLEELRAIARLYPEAFHIVVPADSDIHRIEDLAGHRVSLGTEGSGTLIDTLMILDAHGLQPEQMDAYYLRPELAGDLMIDGELDAFTIVGGVPLLAVRDVARRMPVRILSIEPSVAEQLEADYPFFTRRSVADDVYPGVPGWDSLAVAAIWATRSDLDADLIYAITQSMWHPNTTGALGRGHARGAEIVLEDAVRGLGIPLHEGAARYYEEVGLIEPGEDPFVASANDTPTGEEPAPTTLPPRKPSLLEDLLP